MASLSVIPKSKAGWRAGCDGRRDYMKKIEESTNIGFGDSIL